MPRPRPHRTRPLIAGGGAPACGGPGRVSCWRRDRAGCARKSPSRCNETYVPLQKLFHLAAKRAVCDSIETFAHCELMMRQGTVHLAVEHQGEIPGVIFWKRS